MGLTRRQKAQIETRARGRCEYCLSPRAYVPGPFSIEHIKPVSKGGQTAMNNLAYSCHGCNGYKYNKTRAIDPITQKAVPLFNPRTQQRAAHFRWSGDYLYLIGLTPTGRATVDALKLNRNEAVNLRKALFIIREHPPKTLLK